VLSASSVSALDVASARTTALGAWTENWQLLLGSILLAVVLASRGGLGGLVARLSKRPPW